jgi:MYXO-CTERM domain-containing protein
VIDLTVATGCVTIPGSALRSPAALAPLLALLVVVARRRRG